MISIIKKAFILLLIVLTVACTTTEESINEQPLKIWFDQPTQKWNEGLPIGNGSLGGMIYGTPAKEIICLNEETIWTGEKRYGRDKKAGLTNKTPVTTVDFFSTLLELSGISTLDFPQLEGASLLSLLTEKDKLKERPIYWHFPHHRKEGLSMGAAIRVGEWKYIIEFETEKEYLYNLKEDISENQNLINIYPEKSSKLSKMLKEWQIEVGAQMPALNNEN